ncbi:uncharacterized protein VTP21DRAFT_3116 [Calcarisporiella thermophila]|uniref:uncharacterized protein n=1 Tax=Calcarisporiella thermophila TaxID=911321 RepID=UPI0037420158
MPTFNLDSLSSKIDVNSFNFDLEMEPSNRAGTRQESQARRQNSHKSNMREDGLASEQEHSLEAEHEHRTGSSESGYFSQNMYMTPLTMETNMILDQEFDEEVDELMLISPAITPSQSFFGQEVITPTEIFSPLTSPALLPQPSSSQRPPSSQQSHKKKRAHEPYRKKRRDSKGAAAKESPDSQSLIALPVAGNDPSFSPSSTAACSSAMPPPPPRPTPATPASLMNLSRASDMPPPPPSSAAAAVRPATLGPKALISPNLKPLLPGVSSEEAAARLTVKSNYQTIRDGDSKILGLNHSPELQSGITLRRTSHKAAEQKRRDLLKQCFEDLRGILPEMEHPSKMALLKKSYEYILELSRLVEDQDAKIAELLGHTGQLRRQLGLPERAEPEDSEAEGHERERGQRDAAGSGRRGRGGR